MDFKKYLLSALMVASVYVSVAQIFDPAQSYPAGSQVSFSGNVYEAKWWANPSQSPGNIVTNDWDTPWKLVSEQTETLPQEQDRTELPEPVKGDFPAYAEGNRYQGGELVSNNGNLYRCKTGATVPWCSGTAWALASQPRSLTVV